MKHPISKAALPFSDNLNQLVKQLFNTHLPVAIQHNSFIMNEVSKDISLITNKFLVGNLMSAILQTIIEHTHNSCIKINAREYEDIMFIRFDFNNQHNTAAINYRLEKVKYIADKLYGNLEFEANDAHHASITFRFPNLAFVNWQQYQQQPEVGENIHGSQKIFYQRKAG